MSNGISQYFLFFIIGSGLLSNGIVWAQPTQEASKLPPKTIWVPSLMGPMVGFDQIGFENVSGNKGFIGLQPSLGLLTRIQTLGERSLPLQMAYRLTWLEYPDREMIKRSVEQLFLTKLSVPWSERLSSDLNAVFLYRFKSGSPVVTHNVFVAMAEPNLWVNLNSYFRFKFGYWLRFVQFTDWALEVETAPILSPEFEFLPFSPDGTTGIVASDPVKEDVYLSQQAFASGFEWKLHPKVDLAFDTRWVFEHHSNASYVDTGGWFFIPSLNLKTPWKGGSLSIKDQFWIHRQDKTLIGGASDEINSQNSITFEAKQVITKFFSLETSYQYLSKRSAVARIETIDRMSGFYFGTRWSL